LSVKSALAVIAYETNTWHGTAQSYDTSSEG